jgi:hypothetical protein
MKEFRQSRRKEGKPFIEVEWCDEGADYMWKLKQRFQYESIRSDGSIESSWSEDHTISETNPGPGYMGMEKAHRWAEHYGIEMPEPWE